MKAREALQVEVKDWTLGSLVIGAHEVERLLAGATVQVNFVQQRGDREPFIGSAGAAKISRSGKAINIWLEGHLMTAPLQQVRAVLEGAQQAATVSKPAPIIDADDRQHQAINEGLVMHF